jgi:hypothetical protein
LDALAKIGFSPEEKEIDNALTWIQKRQTPQGYWKSGLKKSGLEDHLWVTLAVLGVIKRFGFMNNQ